mmetsp:Transcript_31610/g.72657  ORF Transcript_31610/g.72657 Transcript_31610/m.72657 type:complete len:280 (+) Transcript_31610:1454-2293(+)
MRQTGAGRRPGGLISDGFGLNREWATELHYRWCLDRRGCVNQIVFTELFGELSGRHWREPSQAFCDFAEAGLRKNIKDAQGGCFELCPQLREHWDSQANAAVDAAVSLAHGSLKAKLNYLERECHVSDHYFASCLMTELAKDAWEHASKKLELRRADSDTVYTADEIEQTVKSFGSAMSDHLGSNEQFEARFYLHMLIAFFKSAHKILLENVWEIVGEEFVRSAVFRAETALDDLLTQPVLINKLLAEPIQRTATHVRFLADIVKLKSGINVASEARGI